MVFSILLNAGYAYKIIQTIKTFLLKVVGLRVQQEERQVSRDDAVNVQLLRSSKVQC